MKIKFKDIFFGEKTKLMMVLLGIILITLSVFVLIFGFEGILSLINS